MVFLGKNRKHLYASDSAIVQDNEVEFMKLRYRFQKNKDNGQKIKYSKFTNIKLCPGRAGMIIRRRTQRLRVKTHTPIAVYSSSSKKKLVAKEVYDLTFPKDIKMFSSHSIRVGTCVLLHSSRKDDKFIKLRLRWKSDVFQLYLRNTTLLA
eukprot:14426244-Ditylum_brightwellii.AAC.1